MREGPQLRLKHKVLRGPIVGLVHHHFYQVDLKPFGATNTSQTNTRHTNLQARTDCRASDSRLKLPDRSSAGHLGSSLGL